jgi:hypothetical protein
MEVFTMVVVIVAIACGSSLISDYLKTRRAAYQHSAAGNEELEAELTAIRQRLAVLEEIVTDNRYQLDRELERLK